MRSLWCLGAFAVASVGAVACGGDDVTNGPVDAGREGRAADATMADGNTGDGGQGDAGPSDAGKDASFDANGTDSGPVPPRVLVSYNGGTTSELVAINIAGKHVDGDLTYPGFIGTTSVVSPAPFLLEQANDVVARLDSTEPWKIQSSWSVKLNDAIDGGAPYSDPDAVLVGTPSRAYVLRYTRNEIAILDPSQTGDAGVPSGFIDLSSLVQAGDSDGTVEMTAGAYDATANVVYVVLANIDTNLVVNNGLNLLCASTVSSVIAIDVATNAIKPLGGMAPGGGIALKGSNPIFGGVAFDVTGKRLLIDEAGCNQAVDGGAGPIRGRCIEAVALPGGPTTILHDGTMDGFPSQFVYIDKTHAVVSYFDNTGTPAYAWDPTSPTLGGIIPNAPDFFASDGQGNLVGTATSFGSDGGSSTNVVSVRKSDGTTTTLATNPFTLKGGFVGGVDVWPHP